MKNYAYRTGTVKGWMALDQIPKCTPLTHRAQPNIPTKYQVRLFILYYSTLFPTYSGTVSDWVMLYVCLYRISSTLVWRPIPSWKKKHPGVKPPFSSTVLYCRFSFALSHMCQLRVLCRDKKKCYRFQIFLGHDQFRLIDTPFIPWRGLR